MTSDLWQPNIDRYVDAELPEEQMRAMDAHLRDCSSCAAETLRQLHLKQKTRLAGRRYTPSVQFRRTIADQVAARPTLKWRWVWSAPLAVAVIVVIVAGMLLSRSSDHARS